jgi:hypothetical protein
MKSLKPSVSSRLRPTARHGNSVAPKSDLWFVEPFRTAIGITPNGQVTGFPIR